MKEKKTGQIPGQIPGQIEMYFPPKKYKIVGHYEDGEKIESGAIESYESAEKFKIGMERLTGDRAKFEIVEVAE